LLRRLAFDFTVLGQLLDDAFHHFAAFVDMSVLTTTEQDGHLNFIVVLKEADRLLDLEVDIVIASFWSNANLFQFGLMSLPFFPFLLLVVLELPEVHDSADGRLRVCSDLDQIQPVFAGTVECVFGWDYAKLFTILINNTDGSNSDLIVDPILVFVDFRFLLND
jgi:hypothetical protein